MGLKFKKTFRKLEKTVKKVAPAALTVVNPALGASFAAVQAGIRQAKARAATQGDTSEDLKTINASGFTGFTSPEGIADFRGPQPPTGDAERFQRWNAGGYGKNFSGLLKSPATLIVALAALVGLLLIVRRRR